MSIKAMTLEKLSRLMQARGVDRLYIKFLAPNDNSKNQIYLGPDFSAINILPHKPIIADSNLEGWRRERFKAALSVLWIDDDGTVEPAPAAQLILYPKYPEVRLSGFLKGTRNAPSAIMNSRDMGRLLILGVSTSGNIYTYATTKAEPLYRELEARKAELEQVSVFQKIVLLADSDSKTLLLRELGRIHHLGWIDSKRLDAEHNILPCDSPQCGGYTLEAELGITPNGRAEPDFLGWEIKQHAVTGWDSFGKGTPLTLMTPEPSEGFYKDQGVEAFVRKFGYPDRNGVPDRLNFGGVYRVGARVKSTGLTMQLDGYDTEHGKITDLDGGICLLNDNCILAAKWKFSDLMRHWERKHAQAAYVPCMRRIEPKRQYCYGPKVKLGEGADFLIFLAAMSAGKVYYDPAVKLENVSSRQPHTKRRSQFRIHPADITMLYKQMRVAELSTV